jgi:SAM-dependent methyltransferase
VGPKCKWKATGKMAIDFEQELIGYGLSPGTWKDSLGIIKGALSPVDYDKFSRLHRNFIGYRSPETHARFYGFVFSHDLHLEINRQRFTRLSGILRLLALEIAPGQSILDIGAGTGIVGSLIKRHLNPKEYVVQDPCPEVRSWLENQGFSVLDEVQSKDAGKKTFDLLLCIDSLGEVNADEDSILSETSDISENEFAQLFEQRYGMVQKLSLWKPFIAPAGRILLWEPFKHNRAWEALTKLLPSEGWHPSLRSDQDGRPFLEIRSL